MKTTRIHDPYRNRRTTYREFADAEGVKKMAVYLYYRRHKTLVGFRDRPPIYSNGFTPHTYTHNGEYISISDAAALVDAAPSTIARYAKRGITDIDRIKKALAFDRKRRHAVTEFARRMGASVNSVYQYRATHGGRLEGFENRGGSRTRPTLYPDTGTGTAKTAKQWAKHYGVSLDAIKSHLKTHGRDMSGYTPRRKHAPAPRKRP